MLNLIQNTELARQISNLDSARPETIDIGKTKRFLEYRVFEMSETAQLL